MLNTMLDLVGRGRTPLSPPPLDGVPHYRFLRTNETRFENNCFARCYQNDRAYKPNLCVNYLRQYV